MKISLYADRAADFSQFCSHGGSAYTVFATGQLSISETYSYRGPTINSRQHYMTSGATATAMTPHLFQYVGSDNPYMEPPDISTVNRGTGRLRGPAMPYIPPSGPWQDRLTRPRRHPSRSSGRCLFHARPTPLPDHAPRGRQYAAGA